MEEIDEQNWEYAHRLFQCVAAASRPLRAEELAEFLAFDFEAGSTPTFLADWRSDDPENEVLSICSTLLVVVKQPSGSPVIQFAHFSVKEYLTSARLAEKKNPISRFHVSMTLAHTIVVQACLGVLLHLDENITEESLRRLPLVHYAAEHWVEHARFENVSPNVLDVMKDLFDSSRSHLPVWVWIYDPESPSRSRSEGFKRLSQPRATPLHYAAFCGMHDIATFLIVERSQDVNACGFHWLETPLHVSSRLGHVAMVRVLLKHGADAEVRDNGDYSPLEQVACQGHVEVTQVLLEYGADANAQDISGCTPLHWASGAGQPAVAQVLLRHGADVTAQCNNKQTPLHRANEEEVARLLLDHGADANALDTNNRTPLHRVSELGRVGASRVLLEHGADVNALDVENQTPLHRVSDLGRVGVAQVLLEHGADADARDKEMCTPLYRASREGQLAVAQVLLDHGADVAAQCKNNQSPLHRAENEEVSQLLLKHGADVNALDFDNQTPLDHVSKLGRVGATRVLLEHGADVNTRDANNATPLHLASNPEHNRYWFGDGEYLGVVRLLLQYGSDIHARDDKGQTPFMRASAEGYCEIMQLLLEHGAEEDTAW